MGRREKPIPLPHSTPKLGAAVWISFRPGYRGRGGADGEAGRDADEGQQLDIGDGIAVAVDPELRIGAGDNQGDAAGPGDGRHAKAVEQPIQIDEILVAAGMCRSR